MGDSIMMRTNLGEIRFVCECALRCRTEHAEFRIVACEGAGLSQYLTYFFKAAQRARLLAR
jgi:hypothetical protein